MVDLVGTHKKNSPNNLGLDTIPEDKAHFHFPAPS